MLPKSAPALEVVNVRGSCRDKLFPGLKAIFGKKIRSVAELDPRDRKELVLRGLALQWGCICSMKQVVKQNIYLYGDELCLEKQILPSDVVILLKL